MKDYVIKNTNNIKDTLEAVQDMMQTLDFLTGWKSWNFDTKYNIPYTETGNKGQGLV